MSEAPVDAAAAAPGLPPQATATSVARPIDEFLHTPARLNICALLAPADWVLFSFLRQSIGTSDSALSKQLSALEQAGYVDVRKERAVRLQTSVRLTGTGRAAFEAYLRSLEALLARARGHA